MPYCVLAVPSNGKAWDAAHDRRPDLPFLRFRRLCCPIIHKLLIIRVILLSPHGTAENSRVIPHNSCIWPSFCTTFFIIIYSARRRWVHYSSMKKRIDISEIRLGMRVVELDRPWLDTPFLYHQFDIKTDTDLAMLRKFCRYIYIEAEEQAATRSTAASQPADKEIHASANVDATTLEFEILKQYSAPRATHIYEDLTSLEEEIEAIQSTYEDAKELIGKLMHDARLGRTPGHNIEPARGLGHGRECDSQSGCLDLLQSTERQK